MIQAQRQKEQTLDVGELIVSVWMGTEIDEALSKAWHLILGTIQPQNQRSIYLQDYGISMSM